VNNALNGLDRDARSRTIRRIVKHDRKYQKVGILVCGLGQLLKEVTELFAVEAWDKITQLHHGKSLHTGHKRQQLLPQTLLWVSKKCALVGPLQSSCALNAAA
jgi:hypothetical protein